MDQLSHVFTLDWLQWLIAVELVGLAALPLSAFLFRSFPDRGYGLAKPLGLLAVFFVNWWLGSVAGIGNYPIVLWCIVVLLGACGLALCRFGLAKRPAELRSLRQMVLIEEALFLVAFVAWSLVRSANPDVFSTEKPMDYMLLQVSGYTHSFPPPDAWLSGHTVNYYYFGYAIFGMIGRLAGVAPRIGFNLSNIVIFAMGCTAAYSLALALSKNKFWGLAGTFTVMLAGDLDGTAQVIAQFLNRKPDLSGLNLWCSTRIIDGGCANYHTITEFPIFSLIWNDLHPHVMAIPFVLLAVGMGIHALKDAPADEGSLASRYVQLGAAALVLGALFGINSWDYPTYLLFLVGAMLIAAYRQGTPSNRSLAEIIAAIPVSLILYLPYFLTVHNSKNLGLHVNPTGPSDLLTVLGGLLIPVAIFVVWRGAVTLQAEGRQPVGEGEREPALIQLLRTLPAGAGWWAIFGFLLLTFVWVARTDLLYLMLLAVGGYALHVRRADDRPEILAALLLAMVAILVLLAGDIGYLRDNFDNSPLYRMNTVFKLYYQAWILLAVAAPLAVKSIGDVLRGSSTRAWSRAWYAAAIVLALGLALYPIEGVDSPGSSLGPALATGNAGLDGLAYVKVDYPHEYAAVSWILAHTKLTDVVAEAYGPLPSDPSCGSDYWICDLTSDANTISALTGRPTLIGWPNSHEALWQGDYGTSASARAAGAMIASREQDVDRLYSTTDAKVASAIIRQYHVAYVYVGPYERSKYYTNPRSPALAKFGTLLEPVLQLPDVTLYRVPAALRA